MSAYGVDLLNAQNTGTLVLLSTRVGGLMLIAPVFASRTVPV